MKNIILFGYGNMGSSIAKGWILKKFNFNFFVIDKIKKGDVIFLAVKPQQMKDAVKSFLKFNVKEILFISIAAGLPLSWFQTHINSKIKIVRSMPNLPASVGLGITGYCYTNNLTKTDKDITHKLLTSFGKVILLDSEDLIDVITAISGSGPAYIFHFVEVLSKIGVKYGLSNKDAKNLVVTTLIGSSRLLELSKIDAETLKKNVTSPGGTTEAGLKILESTKTGLYPLLDLTIKKAKNRASDLNK